MFWTVETLSFWSLLGCVSRSILTPWRKRGYWQNPSLHLRASSGEGPICQQATLLEGGRMAAKKLKDVWFSTESKTAWPSYYSWVINGWHLGTAPLGFGFRLTEARSPQSAADLGTLWHTSHLSSTSFASPSLLPVLTPLSWWDTLDSHPWCLWVNTKQDILSLQFTTVYFPITHTCTRTCTHIHTRTATHTHRERERPGKYY